MSCNEGLKFRSGIKLQSGKFAACCEKKVYGSVPPIGSLKEFSENVYNTETLQLCFMRRVKPMLHRVFCLRSVFWVAKYPFGLFSTAEVTFLLRLSIFKQNIAYSVSRIYKNCKKAKDYSFCNLINVQYFESRLDLKIAISQGLDFVSRSRT